MNSSRQVHESYLNIYLKGEADIARITSRNYSISIVSIVSKYRGRIEIEGVL